MHDDAVLPRILIFAPSFAPAVRSGGPARSISNLTANLQGRARIQVVTRDRDLGDGTPFPGLSGRRVTNGTTCVYYIDENSWPHWNSLVRHLSGMRFDLIMVHSFWDVRFAAIPATLHMLGRLRGPLILMPRGELEPGALTQKAWKKSLSGPAFRALYRWSVDLVGATSEEEAANACRWLPGKHVLTTTNNLPDSIPFGEPRSPHETVRMLFLSRVSPKKGLKELLQGLQHVSTPIQLTVVGPVEDDAYWQQCRRLTARLPAHVEVLYGGMATRTEIPSVLWNADCMVVPTAGENYGHVFAEALQAGCPVITTPTTPWTDVIRGGGGQIIEDRTDATEVAAVLDSWAAKNPAELAEARRQARSAYQLFAEKAGSNIIDLALEATSRPTGVSVPRGRVCEGLACL